MSKIDGNFLIVVLLSISNTLFEGEDNYFWGKKESLFVEIKLKLLNLPDYYYNNRKERVLLYG